MALMDGSAPGFPMNTAISPAPKKQIAKAIELMISVAFIARL